MEALYLEDLLHVITQGLLNPVMILLVVFAAYAIWAIGSVIVESIRERVHFKENLAYFTNAIHDAQCDQFETIIMQSGLLVHQKQALITVVRNMGLPADDLNALAVHELQLQLQRNTRTITRTAWVSKIAPTCGMLGTLIPLSTGMASLEFGDVSTLATSFLTVFDTTAIGLMEAGVCITVNTVRKRWYEKYAQALDNYMKVILQKAADAREAGIELPCGYVYDSGSIRENKRAVKEAKKQKRATEKSAKRAPMPNEVQVQPSYVIDYQVPYYQPVEQQAQEQMNYAQASQGATAQQAPQAYQQPVQPQAQQAYQTEQHVHQQSQQIPNQQPSQQHAQTYGQPTAEQPSYAAPQQPFQGFQGYANVRTVHYQPHDQSRRR